MSSRNNSKSMIRFTAIVILTTIIVCSQIQPASGRGAAGRGTRGGTFTGMPVPANIANGFNAMKGESLEESIKNLYLVDFYYWPGRGGGDGAGGITLPLPESVGQDDIPKILNNLRFIKVYDELSKIPKDKAGRLISDQVNEALALYKKMFSESWDKVFKAHENEPLEQRTGIGPSLQISDEPNGPPTLAGLRYKLLSLVVLAGNLKLEDTKSAIENVASEAIAQRKKFYNPTTGFEGDRFSMLRKAGIYNRQVLATGIILTSDTKTQADIDSAGNPQDRWENRQIARYNASASSPYEMMTPNSSRSMFNARIHKPLSDEVFDKIYRDVIAKKD